LTSRGGDKQSRERGERNIGATVPIYWGGGTEIYKITYKTRKEGRESPSERRIVPPNRQPEEGHPETKKPQR